ncbi:16S rRNA (guanine(966)-N(2))-methyltransferase RsmD [Methylocystis echinoides]|uniref:DNA methyltransferase n=1 Tax=Methylocystis echinoides TaxID=29468 RepID=A0A9W6GQJ7_9HYPH|nr:16S rRNA (guanine(966)-N(2))-methyltransferase RsmD [Methylocystis echinoides]GLI91065.1 DNA methyltransferase [Methylocystis echinoides]
MRIVGGAFRGRALSAPRSQAVRPTSDRLRESVFDILAHRFDDPVAGATVIDLFAGTGALGLEALSRGAARALFVDDGAEARALLRENIEALGLGGVTRVFRRDATKLGAAPPGEVFSLAFLDPPYGKGLARPALAALIEGRWLATGARVVIEEAAGAEIDLPPALAPEDARRYGDTQFVFARYGG